MIPAAALAAIPSAGSAGSSARTPDASVSVDVGQAQGHVSNLLLGQNLLWENSGDGIWNPGAGAPGQTAMSLLQPIQAGLFRFPGGLLANSYDWREGIGPQATRFGQPINSEGNRQPDRFGTDEFMGTVEALHGQALITVDICGSARPYTGCHAGRAAGTSNCPAPPSNCPGAAVAADWVRYLNDPPTTQLGRLRASNGHAAPYHVHYFELGNEVDGDVSAGEYALIASTFSSAMKTADPSIALGADTVVDGQGNGPWLDMLLSLPPGTIDFLAPHLYGPTQDGHSADFGGKITEVSRSFAFNLAHTGVGTLNLSVVGSAQSMISVVVDQQLVGTLRPTGTCYPCTIGDSQSRFQARNIILTAGPHTLTLSCHGCSAGQVASVLAAYHRDYAGTVTQIDLAPVSAADFEHVVYGSAHYVDGILTGIRHNLTMAGSNLAIIPTEWGSLYGGVNDWATQNEDLATTLMEAMVLQSMIRNAATGAAIWDLNSWYFHLIHLDTSRYALPGLLFTMLASNLRSSEVASSVTSKSFDAPESDGLPAVSGLAYVNALATADSRQVDLQLVNLDPNPEVVHITLSSCRPQGNALLTSLTAATPWTIAGAANAPAQAQSSSMTAAGNDMTITLPGRSFSILSVPLG